MNVDVNQLRTPEFWQNFAPQLHIADLSFFRNLQLLKLSPDELETVAELMKVEGYFQAHFSSSPELSVNYALLAQTVRSLVAANLSPVFAFLYDEFWVPFYKLHRIISTLLGGEYFFLPDFWVWNVDPAKGERGWRPHRDKGRWALLPDGMPRSLTVWIPLSNATTLNGCVYIVPSCDDPTYGTEEEADWRFEYSSIRALPARPGEFFMWNQAVLHWGSKASPRGGESRISMAFEFQRADVQPPFNQPLMQPLGIISFEERLKLVAKQILQYKSMYQLEPELQEFAESLIAVPTSGTVAISE